MIVNRDASRGGNPPPYLRAGEYDAVLEAQDNPLFGLTSTVVYCYILHIEPDVKTTHVVNDLGAIFMNTPMTWNKSAKMVSICRAALECTGKLPSVNRPPSIPSDSAVWAWGKTNFSNEDALYGSRIHIKAEHVDPPRRIASDAVGYAKMTFLPLVSGPEEIALRLNVARGLHGAAEVLVDWLFEQGHIPAAVAEKMLTVRRDCKWRHAHRWRRTA